MSSRTWVITNPAAGRGLAHQLSANLGAQIAPRWQTEFHETTIAGEEESLATEALAAGAQTIIAVGGDGTCSHIANAILRSQSTCRLAVVASGTGNDFAKTLGVEKYKPGQIAELMAGGKLTAIDVGFADGHYYLNSCGFGFDPSVLDASNDVRFLKGNAVYVYSALRQLFSYPGVDVSADGVAGVKRQRMLMITVSNGRYLGGAFKIAPHASVLDGRLDACFFSDSNVVERMRLFAGALRGTHLGMPQVISAKVQQLTLTFPSPPQMEIDGELRTARSKTVELRCIPRALSVIAAPGAIQ